MDVNKITLVGSVVSKPKTTNAGSDRTKAAFSVATNSVWKDGPTKEPRETTEFHRVVAWGKLAEIVINYVEKGARLYVEGRIRPRVAEDRTQQKRTTTEVVADEIIMLSQTERGDRA